FAAGAATMMTELRRRGVAHVVWVTLRERQPGYADTNRSIRELAKQWPGVVRVVDWNAISQRQPWFEQDDVHLNTDGAVNLAQATPKVYEIVLFGFDTRAAAIDYYLQAKARGFRLTVAPNIDNCGNENGGWQAVFGHTTTRAAAASLLERIRAAGFSDGSGIQ